MNLLAIETSTRTTSVAVLAGDGRILASHAGHADTHSEQLLPLIAQVLAQAAIAPRALDAVAVGVGPGSFTGLRIGVAAAKGVAFAADRPLWVVSSLAALALDLAACSAADVLVPILDARRGELFAGCYRRTDTGIAELAPDQVIVPAELAAMVARLAPGDPHIALGGDGVAAHSDRLGSAAAWVVVDGPTTPTAGSIGRLALAGARADVLGHGAPRYIRPAEAEVKYPTGVPGARRTH
jgi:tRNA threonylcarbamoyladenosine biosynthesis protein TsaB